MLRRVDEYLKFEQQNFNVNDMSFKDIIMDLDYRSSSLHGLLDKRSKEQSDKANKLRNQLNQITILSDLGKYDKFDKLGNFGLSDNGLIDTYRLADEIIRDLDVARDWLESYRKYNEENRKKKGVESLHGELIMLGKSILGRAIEMTPMDTGILRESGVMYDFGTYIIIAFTAPYASYVHDNLELRHPNGGRAKFLEVAVQEFFPDNTVWVENLGYEGVMVKIGINPLIIEYSHYS